MGRLEGRDRDGVSRREFVALAAAGAIGGRVMSAHAQEQGGGGGRPARLRKALKYGMIQPGEGLEEKFRIAREAGFDGVELDAPGDWTAEEVLAAKERTGLEVPGLVDSAHWSKPLSHGSAEVRAEGLAALERAIRDCHAIGAETVLLVPAVVSAEVCYADAYRRSQEEIRRVLPLARDLGVTIAIENVWNHFLLSPLEGARYVDELAADAGGAIGWYFDVGNIVTYGWPAHWIRTLGERIVRLDIKDFSRSKRDKEGLWKGFDVEIGEGDADWAAVRAALREIGYAERGAGAAWASAEVGGGDAARLADIARRMDAVLGGE